VAWSAHKDDEVKGVLAALQALLAQSIDARDICVVARDNWQLQNTWAPALKEAGIAALQIESDVDEGSAGPGVRLCTMHRAKGLEFRHVFVVGLGDDRYPHRTEAAEDDPVAAGWEEARERSLFFVACTRARESLRVSGWGERKAGFIPG
jgi:ATP-dependent exoDNAse (exonuclease V) beta subunit